MYCRTFAVWNTWRGVSRAIEVMAARYVPVLLPIRTLCPLFSWRPPRSCTTRSPRTSTVLPKRCRSHQLTISEGKRISAAGAYLHPIADHPNLTILTGTRARRLLFQGQRRCIGVEYQRDGEPGSAGADAEVILCAGAIESPRLLLASGVGPADHLREVGIEVIHDLPGVGMSSTTIPCSVRRGVESGDRARYGKPC